MTIRQWPTSERPRERLIKLGPQALSDAELLAIFLRTGSNGKDAVSFARELLRVFNGIRGLIGCSYSQFIQYPGLGPAKYAQLAGAVELSKRHLSIQLENGCVISDPHTTRRYFQSWLRDHPSEVFACLYLDSRHRVLHCESVFQGTIDGASVYPREIVRRCIKHNAAAVIFAHNHPSGVAEPSDADRHITHKLKTVLAHIDVKVLDHLVVGDGQTISLAERGLL